MGAGGPLISQNQRPLALVLRVQVQPFWSPGFVIEVGVTHDFRKLDHKTLGCFYSICLLGPNHLRSWQK